MCGIKLKNPIGIAAGFDKDGEAIQGLHKLGQFKLEIKNSLTHLKFDSNRFRFR